MIYTLDNIYDQSKIKNPVIIRKIIGGEKWHTYELVEEVKVCLSNGVILNIPAGFKWDLSSVPRIFWSLLPPDGNFIIAALIHDWLYANKERVIDWFQGSSYKARAFADKEMLLWSTKMNGTRRISLRNIDNHSRYYGVRIGGWVVWNK